MISVLVIIMEKVVWLEYDGILGRSVIDKKGVF